MECRVKYYRHQQSRIMSQSFLYFRGEWISFSCVNTFCIWFQHHIHNTELRERERVWWGDEKAQRKEQQVEPLCVEKKSFSPPRLTKSHTQDRRWAMTFMTYHHHLFTQTIVVCFSSSSGNISDTTAARVRVWRERKKCDLANGF